MPTNQFKGITIYGEQADEVLRPLSRSRSAKRVESLTDVEFDLVDFNCALTRAMFRAEAELLCEDADAMAAGTYEDREPGERRHDALVRILQMITERAGLAPTQRAG